MFDADSNRRASGVFKPTLIADAFEKSPRRRNSSEMPEKEKSPRRPPNDNSDKSEKVTDKPFDSSEKNPESRGRSKSSSKSSRAARASVDNLIKEFKSLDESIGGLGRSRSSSKSRSTSVSVTIAPATPTKTQTSPHLTTIGSTSGSSYPGMARASIGSEAAPSSPATSNTTSSKTVAATPSNSQGFANLASLRPGNSASSEDGAGSEAEEDEKVSERVRDQPERTDIILEKTVSHTEYEETYVVPLCCPLMFLVKLSSKAYVPTTKHSKNKKEKWLRS